MGRNPDGEGESVVLSRREGEERPVPLRRKEGGAVDVCGDSELIIIGDIMLVDRRMEWNWLLLEIIIGAVSLGD